AVRLPKECRFPGKEVCVSKMGDAVILFPKGKEWDLLESAISQFTDDYMARRDQPTGVERRKRL
ncbi:MAG TPA: type II toxin-antitoxin system VapB family antitoxin, partial [Tepidisphaeraceae bacterium]|nr:type II toxin-antitoxin system VapB family antitoxin [Tepidisphaeraceae bacterium]